MIILFSSGFNCSNKRSNCFKKTFMLPSGDLYKPHNIVFESEIFVTVASKSSSIHKLDISGTRSYFVLSFRKIHTPP